MLPEKLSPETIETRPVFDGEEIRDLEVERNNRAKDLIPERSRDDADV